MALYDISGQAMNSIYAATGTELTNAFDANGNMLGNLYANYYAYWKFTDGDSSNTTTVRNLVTDQDDAILVGIDGSTSGYLTDEGLTLGTTSGIRIPITDDMPDNISVLLRIRIPSDAYANGTPLRDKSFLSFVKGNTNMLAAGIEKYAQAWPAMYGIAEGQTNESNVAWRYDTDAEGNKLNHSGQWWTSTQLTQDANLVLCRDGSGKYRMADIYADNWTFSWDFPIYADGKYKYPGFTSYKEACDAIVLGNRADMQHAISGAVLIAAFIVKFK